MEQAIISVDGQLFGKTYVPDEFTEKFAELIALECAELMEKQHSWITNISASKLIRHHFGVEE